MPCLSSSSMNSCSSSPASLLVGWYWNRSPQWQKSDDTTKSVP
jgi:hypothetical protein